MRADTSGMSGKQALIGVLKRPQFHGRNEQRQRRRIAFHPKIVTRVEIAATDVDRKCIPCLACGGVNEYGPEEEKFVLTRMTVKGFRKQAAQTHAVARLHFNEAAAEEAHFRAHQLLESLASVESGDGLGSGLRTRRARKEQPSVPDPLAEKHYQEHLGLMQRANKQYHMQRQGHGQVRQAPPQQPPQANAAPFMSAPAAQQQQRLSTRVAEPPGGRSNFVFG